MAKVFTDPVISGWLTDNSKPFDVVMSNVWKQSFNEYSLEIQPVQKEEPMSKKNPAAASSLWHQSKELLVFYPRDNENEDYEDNTVDMGVIPYTNIRDLLARFFINTHVNWGAIENWRKHCIGITSWAAELPSGPGGPPGSYHVPLFDYDGRNVKTVIRRDVETLQNRFGLGPAWVFKTRRGFHIYFFTDLVPFEIYSDMLRRVQCCRGFKHAAEKKGFGVLRVSAKYTDFDIQLEQIIPARDTKLRRKRRKAHIVEALLAIGQECGTHFASQFPAWARYREDPKPWRKPIKKAGDVRARKKLHFNPAMQQKAMNPDKLAELAKAARTLKEIEAATQKKQKFTSLYGNLTTVHNAATTFVTTDSQIFIYDGSGSNSTTGGSGNT